MLDEIVSTPATSTAGNSRCNYSHLMNSYPEADIDKCATFQLTRNWSGTRDDAISNRLLWNFSHFSVCQFSAGLTAADAAARLRQQFGQRNGITFSPFISPLMYQDLQSMSNISLHLYVCETDPVLDHSIIMAKKWKGKVHLKAKRLLHGYMNFTTFSKEASDALDDIIQDLRRVIEEDDSRRVVV